MSRVFYEVQAVIADEATESAWLDWIKSKHFTDVIVAGAVQARLVKLDAVRTYASQYEFFNRAEFDAYIENHAPRLRAEGLELFGADAITYVRRSGTIGHGQASC